MPNHYLTEDQISFYRDHGYLVVRSLLDEDETAALSTATEAICETARGVTSHTDVLDLEDSHTADDPRVRRIKSPDRVHPAFAAVVTHPKIIAILRDLLSSDLRFDTGKLNIKAAAYGAPVEWHQDWAFYPHTNDDLAAVGVMLDDCSEENGPLMVVPGSHRGTTFDHHADGRFCGSIDIEREGIDLSSAVALTAPAGSISIHHARILHGSAPNRSGKPRRLLLNQYRAADAWPLLGVSDYDAYKAQLVAGNEPAMPRLVHVPIRLPLPPAERTGSIYENQKGRRSSSFERTSGPDAAGGRTSVRS